MAFNVSNLNDFIEQNRLPLIKKANFGADTVKYINVLTNVKNVTNLNLIDTQAVIADRACGWSASGDTTFSARELKVRRAQIEAEYCLYDLEDKYLNEGIKARVNGNELDEMAFGEDLLSGLMESANKQVETAIWQGTSAQTGFDGFLAIAAAASASTLVSVSSAASVWDKVLAVYQEVDEEILDKVELFTSIASFRSLVLELVQKNLYHYTPEIDDALTITIPGTQTKLHGVSGLKGTSVVFAAEPRNMFYGCDAEDDVRAIDSFYDKSEDKWKVRCNFNYGAQIAFPDMVRYAE